MAEAGTSILKIVTSIFFFCAGIYVLLCAYLWLAQSRFVYFPRRALAAAPTDAGLEYEDITYRAGDGTKIHAWYVPAPGEQGVILFCHGNAGNISHRIDTLQIFNRLGFSTFIFDYRGYGRSEGKPSEQGTYLDVQGAWDWLVEKRGIDPRRIVIAGRSLGGAVGSRLAARETPGALIVESAFSSAPDMGAKFYPFLPVRLLSRFDYSTKDHVKNVHCPVLVIHSPDDEMCPFAHGQEIFAAAHPPKKFLKIWGSHNEGYRLSLHHYIQGLEEFLKEHLTTK